MAGAGLEDRDGGALIADIWYSGVARSVIASLDLIMEPPEPGLVMLRDAGASGGFRLAIDHLTGDWVDALGHPTNRVADGKREPGRTCNDPVRQCHVRGNS